MAETYNQTAIDALVNSGRPIPGQSLTNDPDQKYPWEGPPEYTDFRQALNFITGQLLQEDIFAAIMKGIGDGVPLADITLQMLQTGFEQGKWNPDLLTMLIEPTIYTLMALSEKAGIKYRINGDEEDDIDEEDEKDITNMRANNLKKYVKAKVTNQSTVPSGAIPKEVLQQIEEAPVPESLLAREESEQVESLLARGEE
jgi:hypothetical protein|tara:strand:+ start:1849 stop:2445 length:597 start_codon:yes stop_codon:yes gene_type:complete